MIGKEQYEGRFYVTPRGSQVVLGTSFMKDYEVRITIGQTSSCYIGGKPVELLELGTPSQPVLSACEVEIGAKEERNIPVVAKDPIHATTQALYEPMPALFRTCGIMAPEALVEGDASPFYIRVFNPTQQPLVIRARTRLGTLQEVNAIEPAYNHLKLMMGTERLEKPAQSPLQTQKKTFTENLETLAAKTETFAANPKTFAAKLSKIAEEVCDAEINISKGIEKTDEKYSPQSLAENLEQEQEVHDHVTGDETFAAKLSGENCAAETEQASKVEQEKHDSKPEVPSHLTDLYAKSIQQVAEDLHRDVSNVLNEFSDIFATNPADIGRTNLIVHDIYTGKATPVHLRTSAVTRGARGHEETGGEPSRRRNN